MGAELNVLIAAAVTIACLHTLTGPDHYLPFIALSKARGWSLGQTLFWTVVCGCGHVWSSVLLGLGAAAIGWSLSTVRWLEGIRGGAAGWALLVFGLLYALWGLLQVRKRGRHRHFDIYEDGSIYVFEHRHGETVPSNERHRVTPWVLFIIFVLGPCEPMIPLLYFPAAKNSAPGMVVLIAVYTVVTLVTMAGMVVCGYYGVRFLRTERLERYMHPLGGMTIFVCGLGMVFLSW